VSNLANVGGKAAKRTLSLAEIEEIQNRAFEMGVEQGRESEQRLARLEEPNDCPMCALQEEHRELKRSLVILKQKKSSRWSWA
jgi:hypothetical protein